MRYLLSNFDQVCTRFIEGVPVPLRNVFSAAVQVILALLANIMAFELRFEAMIPEDYWQLALKGLPLVVLIYGVVLWGLGIHRGLWRYVGMYDLKLILSASVVSTVALYLLLHWVLGWEMYPRSVIVLTGVLSVMFLGGVRVGVRVFRTRVLAASLATIRLMVIGAGNAGEMLVRDLKMNPPHRYNPVVFVDDNPVKQKRTIHGVPVEGVVEDIPILVRRYAVKEIVVAIPSADPSLIHRILMASNTCHLPIKTLPSVSQLLNSPVSMQQARPISLEDLLQREPVQTDLQELHFLSKGKRVLVTGAGGSIGSELCRQIATYEPAALVLFDHHENSLYALDLELRESFPCVDIRAVVGDVTDAEGVKATFTSCMPQLIFHAAAHKHVPLMEQNPSEAIRNNVFGTRIVGEASLAAGVERFVLISTDKSINPTNVMGATKRIAESIVQAMNKHGRTLFTVVRFGNVLGSNGSVVPLFAAQIKKGGPVTVTHPDIKRYFMTIPESVQLILQASARSQGGDVFVLDMGRQIRVADMARNMIALSGLVPDQDVKIVYTGLRPGEKLFEELFEHGERVELTSHNRVKRAISKMLFSEDEFSRRLDELEAAIKQGEDASIFRQLQEMVPTYCPYT